ncbi:VOC family protein [Afifella sp. JA880]|uniref:VOC family protein n=1 Tax=Afifella sp. JA880 TaxID=2975280 RepID=UPI0021BB8456|nr:VOC family protein [Afifella sp. JA880]MCT8265988.1 VOC family protein [Afifella sp. JA880]
MRPIDHLVLPVAALASARERLTELGFQVSPDARHPFGTGNARVFFKNRTYLEPIATLDQAVVDKGIAEGLVFLDRIAKASARAPEGFAMLALKGDDAEEALDLYRQKGFGVGDLFSFVGKARNDAGEETEYGVRLAFAADPKAPEAAIFVCQPVGMSVNTGTHYCDHPNGSEGVVAVAAVAKNPADFHVFLSAVTGQRELRATSFLVEAELGSQRLLLMTPAGFENRYGATAPDPGDGFVFAAFEVLVDNLDKTREFAPDGVRHGERLVVPPAPGLGTVLAFVENR